MLPIVLWDIDGTLIRSQGGRVALHAFLHALQSLCQLDHPPAYPSDSSGKTDSQLALEVMAGLNMSAAQASALLPAFERAYHAELLGHRAELVRDLRVLPGVRELLGRLQRLGVVQTLLTGNLEPIARLKLACVNLDGFLDFEVGAYGSDHQDRDCLVPVSRERLRQRRGLDVPVRGMVVVGDTPRDIACARAGAARVLAVATGQYTRSDLEAHSPDAVVGDLSDTDSVLASLLGLVTAVQ